MSTKRNKVPVIAAEPTQAQQHPSLDPASRNAKGQYMARPVVSTLVHRSKTKLAHKPASKSRAE